MNDFEILVHDNLDVLRKAIIRLLDKGYTTINVWSDQYHWYAALQKIDPITVAAYANQTWGGR